MRPAGENLRESLLAPATFSLFARKLPRGWGYFLAAGLDDVLAYLESLTFVEADLAYLQSTGLFSPPFLDYVGKLRFSGSVRALPEGTVCFPDEALIEVAAPMIEAQIVESAIVNQIHFQTFVASKAARCAYLAGFDATSNVLAGRAYGIPIAGTLAHSYIQAFEDELAAFRTFALAYPDTCTLLIDTYDAVEGARRAAIVGCELAAEGHG